MHPQRPCIPECLNGQDIIRLVFLVVLGRVHPLLEVGVVLNAIGWIDVDDLDLAPQVLVMNERLHNMK